MEYLNQIGKRAKAAVKDTQRLPTNRDEVLRLVANGLMKHTAEILAANEFDIERARSNGMSQGLLDRLLLTPARIEAMAQGLEQIANLESPVGEVISKNYRPNGLLIEQVRVPIGVIGIIYEARPNVTVDAFGLCFKTDNVAILKGGSDAISSNKAIVHCIRDSLTQAGVNPDALLLIEDTSRETATAFMRLNEYVDVLIPRGGAGLIRTVVNNSNIPVIETGTGNCHIYVDSRADIEMAVNIILNAKTQRVGVCNACESLLIHRDIKDRLLPTLATKLREKNVEIRGDEDVRAIISDVIPATEEDWGTEYLDYIISMKIVDSLEEAAEHINKYGTGHSEAIVTQVVGHGEKFADRIDAACVYVNASTRFTDGFEFGFGAEIGISTQKLHARGPMGLLALTTTKYIIYGNGQIRS